MLLGFCVEGEVESETELSRCIGSFLGTSGKFSIIYCTCGCSSLLGCMPSMTVSMIEFIV